jgi:hypothetical protein
MWKKQKKKKKRVYTILHCENLLLEFLPCPLGPEQAARLSFGSPKEKETYCQPTLFFPHQGFGLTLLKHVLNSARVHCNFPTNINK